MRQFCYGLRIIIGGLAFASLPFSSFGSSNFKQEEAQEKTLTSVNTLLTPVALSPEYSLPHDVRVHILSYLNAQKDLLRIGTVSKSWRKAAAKIWEKRWLDFSNKSLITDHYTMLAKGIFPCLKLNKVWLNEEGMNILAMCFHLQALELRNNNLCAQEPLIKLLSLTRLSHIDLYNNAVGDEGIKAMAEALKQNKTLTWVNLSVNQLSTGEVKAIAWALSQNTTLTTVNLRSNRISDEGARAIAGALSQNKTLTTVDLRDNSIGAGGAIAIAGALTKNKTLTTINLGGNSIDDEGAKAIARALSQNTTLTTVDLNYNSIGDEGKKALADFKHSRPSLQIYY